MIRARVPPATLRGGGRSEMATGMARHEGGRLRPFIIRKPEGDGLTWPIFDNADGRRGIVFFMAAAKAERFLATRGFGPDWGVEELPPTRFVEWLTCNLRDGVANVHPDPDPEAEVNSS